MAISKELIDKVTPDHLDRAIARNSLIDFTKYTKPDYTVKPFHEYIASRLDAFARKEIKKLMIFAPPQHGKSELTSRRFPAYLLGKRPNERVAAISYNAPLARKFNRSVQRIIDSSEYRKVFPNTKLFGANVRTVADGSYLRNSDEFEIVGHNGSYLSVGIGGGLTGNPVDVAVLDDVIKDRKEADSKVYRDAIWEWWTDVLLTRLHNDSQILITLTRWHEDDLCGRILADEEEAAEWEVIILPAIKEDNDDPDDPREIGEALWPEKHSLKKLLGFKRSKPRTFTSLYQQRPAPKEGELIKRNWFPVLTLGQYAQILNNANKVSPRLFLSDTAYTNDQKNDPCGFMTIQIIDDNIYILNYLSKRLEFQDYIKFLSRYLKKFLYNKKSFIFVEPKATGKSVVQVMKRQRLEGKLLNIKEDKPPEVDKYTRASAATETLEVGRVHLIAGAWNEPFLDEICIFPNGKHDEAVDLLVMAVDKLENGYRTGGGGLKASNT